MISEHRYVKIAKCFCELFDHLLTHAQFGADIVSMLVHIEGRVCGMAVPGPTKENMFSVTNTGCAIGTYTFGHEIAHNMVRDVFFVCFLAFLSRNCTLIIFFLELNRDVAMIVVPLKLARPVATHMDIVIPRGGSEV